MVSQTDENKSKSAQWYQGIDVGMSGWLSMTFGVSTLMGRGIPDFQSFLIFQN